VNHEAGEEGTGIAVLPGHTAYQVPMYKTRRGAIPFNRPGIPPNIITWADKDYLERYAQEIASLRKEVDFVVASCHWGLTAEVLTYMKDIAHCAIDAGADLVMGHGPHRPLPMGTYKGKPIFYGLGSFSFHTGHDGIKHGDWVGLMVDLEVEHQSTRTSFSFVRHNDANETVPCETANEGATLDWLSKESLAHGAVLKRSGNDIIVVASK
jgi:poly-gamma-glutamate capsule biosynthesis protein CapA/YwtB (metallophosphatase superfamily)